MGLSLADIKKLYTKEDKKTLLLMLLEGLSQRGLIRKMQELRSYPVTKTYIRYLTEQLIADGAITQEKINEKRMEYSKAHPAAWGLDGTKKSIPKGNEKATKRHNTSVQRKEKTLALLKKHFSKAEVARELQISETAVEYYIKQLIAEQRITRAEITQGTNSNRKVDKKDPKYLATRALVLECLNSGWKNHTIRQYLNITPYDFNIFMRDIKEHGLMTSEQIAEARETRHQADLDFVEDQIVNQHHTLTQIRALKPEFSYNEVTPLVRELIWLGRVTQEQVDNNSKKGSLATLNRNRQMTPEEQTLFVILKVMLGYKPSEILASDKTGSLSLPKVLWQKGSIIKQGIITKEEADNAMKARAKEQLEKKHRKQAKIIAELLKEGGYTQKELKSLTGYTIQTIRERRKEFSNEEWWPGEVEIENARHQRLYTPEERQRIQETKQLQEQAAAANEERRRKAEAQRAKDEKDLEVVKKHFRNYLTPREIANEMKCDIQDVYRLIKNSKRRKTWIPKEEEASIIAKRKQLKQQKKIDLIKEEQAAKEEALNNKISMVIGYIKEGKTYHEIATLMGCGTSSISRLVKRGKQKEIWQQDKELAKIEEEKRIAREKNKAKKEDPKIRAARRKAEEKQEMAIFLQYIKAGYTYKEISTKMFYSETYLTRKMRQLCIKYNCWPTDEERRFFKEQRKIREKKEKQKQEEQQAREEREAYKEAERQLRHIRAKENEEKRRVTQVYKQMKPVKDKAQDEDQEEFEGYTTSTTEREAFLNLIVEYYFKKEPIPPKIRDAATEIVVFRPDLINTSILKALILSIGDIDKQEEYVKSLKNDLLETKFYYILSKLLEYMSLLRKQAAIHKLKQESSKTGRQLSNAEIAERLHMSSAEVATLYVNKVSAFSWEDVDPR